VPSDLSWDASKRFLELQGPSFLEILLRWDKDTVPYEIVEALRPYLELDCYEYNALLPICAVCARLAVFVRHVVEWYDAAHLLMPGLNNYRRDDGMSGRTRRGGLAAGGAAGAGGAALSAEQTAAAAAAAASGADDVAQATRGPSKTYKWERFAELSAEEEAVLEKIKKTVHKASKRVQRDQLKELKGLRQAPRGSGGSTNKGKWAPTTAVLTMEAVQILLSPDGYQPRFKSGSWESSRRMLSRPSHLVRQMQQLKLEQMAPENFKALKPYIGNADLDDKSFKLQGAVALWKWVRCCSKYHDARMKFLKRRQPAAEVELPEDSDTDEAAEAAPKGEKESEAGEAAALAAAATSAAATAACVQ
jgi:hypothetical protein